MKGGVTLERLQTRRFDERGMTLEVEIAGQSRGRVASFGIVCHPYRVLIRQPALLSPRHPALPRSALSQYQTNCD